MNKRLALDEIDEGREATIVRLRNERDELRARLGTGPPNPSPEYRRLSEAHRKATHLREGAL